MSVLRFERPRRTLEPSELASFVADAALERVEGSRTLWVPAPTVSLASAWTALSPRRRGLLWAPPEGWSLVGAGVAHEIVLEPGEGAGRAKAAAEAIWRGHDVVEHPLASAPPARLFGGLAFSPGSVGAPGSPWSDFGAGRFQLPRWLYARDGGQASLGLTLTFGSEDSDPVRDVTEKLEALARAAGSQPAVAAPSALQSLPVRREEVTSYLEAVEEIRRAIAAGDFEKIVAARCTEFDLPGPFELPIAIERLARQAPSCTRFAFVSDGGVFFGATPERLVRRHGRELRSEALAGSVEPGVSAREAAERLRASDKDAHEHSLVVRHLVDRLEPLCDELIWEGTPRVRQLRDVIHLDTPIRGELREPIHVLDLVARLHPTPAVGGVPTDASTAWIEENEPTPRGWYAGPFGWFDEHGDGDFGVALRSCLVRRGRAWVFAGSGIVADSDPQAELEETRIKQRAMVEALAGAVARA